MNTQHKIAACLWFEKDAAEAARFYVAIFPDAYIVHQATSTVDWPGGKAGDVIVVDFVLAGQRYQALNGGANENATFNESVSLSVTCEDQAEVDRYWDALIADGGEPIMSNSRWCKASVPAAQQSSITMTLKLSSARLRTVEETH